MKPMKTAPALLAALALTATLAACSGDSDTTSPGGTGGNPALSDTFDWSRASHGPAKTVSFAFSDELTTIAPEAGDLAMVPISATARELDSAKYCAVDVEYSYPDGVDALFEGSDITEDETRLRFASDADELGVTTYQEWRKAYADKLTEEQRGYGYGEDTVSKYVAETMAEREKWNEIRFQEALEGQATWEKLPDGQRVLGKDARPVSELDGSEEGVFFTDDLKTVTYVMRCTSDASDPDGDWIAARLAGGEWQFAEDASDAKFSNPYFASADIAVMKNGDLLITDAEVKGYETDSNGDWIAG